MARPKKQTVDYFPHIIKQGKTMTILENKFGNDGYAFWFKLLEILGSTDGHFYEYKSTTDKEFLHAKTLVDEETATEILDLLAELNAIDQELWEQNIIWCDNFVDNIEDAYSRRKVNVPHKPRVSGVNVNRNSTDENKCSHNDDINSQSKVKESKLNKSKSKEEADFQNFFENNSEQFQPFLQQMSKGVVLNACKISVKKDNPLAYCKTVLKDWDKKGIESVKDLNKSDCDYKYADHFIEDWDKYKE